MGEFFTIAVAVAILVAVARWKRPVRPITVIFLILLTVAWIWANLRNTGLQEELQEATPEGLDPFTSAMFWRGWPLAPVMFCLFHHMRLRPEGGEGLVLVFDWLVLFLALCLARFVCEQCSRAADSLRHQKSHREE